MDASTFDHLTRTLFTHRSRRAALGVLLTGAGSALGLTEQRVAAQPSCLANGERCRDGSDCCSGLCKRRSDGGKKRCRQAEHQGICTIEGNYCDHSIFCGTGSSATTCGCFVTTKGRSFCGDLTTSASGCSRNRECERRLGQGAKCLQATGICRVTFCAAPCPEPAPPAEAA